MMEGLQPAGVGVVVTASHVCLMVEGEQQQAYRTTSCWRGEFVREETREEFMALIASK